MNISSVKAEIDYSGASFGFDSSDRREMGSLELEEKQEIPIEKGKTCKLAVDDLEGNVVGCCWR